MKKLYTAKVVAQWLNLTERRVRQLRDEGVIQEEGPGLYDLPRVVRSYIAFVRDGTGAINLNAERAGYMAAKRTRAEMENQVARKELHRTEDIEQGMQTVLLNLRSRFLSMPAKLAPTLASMDGNRAAIQDALQDEIYETLEEVSDWRNMFTEVSGDEEGEGQKTG